MPSIPDPIREEGADELSVTFYPPLFLQRRIWLLDVLREKQVTHVLDVGCGEGQLLQALCRPAPWLSPPPNHLLQSSSSSSDPTEQSPECPDRIPNLHVTSLHGLDISSTDLAFAIENTSPNEEVQGGYMSNIPLRWENLEVKIWKGGLESINEEFIDVECIVSTEVVEHLPPDIFPSFAPMLLGVYHPRFLLITTPSYTFNARFTAPSAPKSARKGYPDPTGRTDRIFRHDDHKFEWTVDEFQSWCEEVAVRWGYEVKTSGIGRALEVDEWGRDDELGGATQVAIFERIDMEGREEEAWQLLTELRAEAHNLLATHRYSAHPEAKQPRPFTEIGLAVKKKMEDFRESFVRVEEIWFEQDIAILCGGWIEMLVRAVEVSEFLNLKKDGDDQERGSWTIEVMGGVVNPKPLWTASRRSSVDYIPKDWAPEEEEAESSEEGWIGSTDMDGDVSLNGSEDDESEQPVEWHSQWGPVAVNIEEKAPSWDVGWAETGLGINRVAPSPASSMTGWDGDQSDDTT